MKYKFLLFITISALALTACGNTTNVDTNISSTEIAVPNDTENIEMGEEINFEWVELGYLKNYPEFRAAFDELANNNIREDGTKTGMCYVDLDMRYTNNSTLRYVFNIEAFHDRIWNNEEAVAKLVDMAKEVYADINSDTEARLASINAYYNLFATPDGYFNGSDTLTRAEFYTGVYKAHSPVTQLEANVALPTDEYNPFVNQMLPYSYLDLANNTKAYDGVITRGEAIYTLVKMYYGGLDSAFDSKMPSVFTDAVCLEVEATDSKSTELNNALQNPDAGVPVEIYKALFVAYGRGIIDRETRWDEGITKTEVLDMLTRIYTDKEMVEAVEFSTTENISGNQSEQSENNVSGNTEQSEQTNEESKKGANLHIIKTPDGIIAGSSALKEAINSSLNKHGISTNYQNDILVDYYNVTVNKDNTKIHNDVIDNLVSSLADALKAQEQQQNQNQNTGSGSSSNNNQDYEENDSGVAPEDYTPEPYQPSPGEYARPSMGDGGDGGPITGDAEAIIP